MATIEPKGPDKAYHPCNAPERLAYFAEEAGECIAAAGKIFRWGYDAFNPELPEAERETNRAWLRREVANLKAAIELIEPDLLAKDGTGWG